jgi:hypothetical protein
MRLIVDFLVTAVAVWCHGSVAASLLREPTNLVRLAARQLSKYRDMDLNLPGELAAEVRNQRVFGLRELVQQLPGNDMMNAQMRIGCRNSYERLWAHRAARIVDVAHGRFGVWDSTAKSRMDPQCLCRMCWKSAGESGYRLAGVWMSAELDAFRLNTRKDKVHARLAQRRERLEHLANTRSTAGHVDARNSR